ncbi:MAG: AbrB/MazE/SpoVT family DNA-binding domain-containing protein [Candidatus Bathyarchaeia archaeon]
MWCWKVAVVTLSSKGQITLPKKIRDELRIREGSKLQVLRVGGQVVLILLPQDPIKALKGSLRFRRSIGEIMREMREEERHHETVLQKLGG